MVLLSFLLSAAPGQFVDVQGTVAALDSRHNIRSVFFAGDSFGQCALGICRGNHRHTDVVCNQQTAGFVSGGTTTWAWESMISGIGQRHSFGSWPWEDVSGNSSELSK